MKNEINRSSIYKIINIIVNLMDLIFNYKLIIISDS